MISVTNKSGPFVAPQVNNNPAFAEAEKLRNAGNESVNFEKILGTSNIEAAEQFEKDKQAVGENGELRIGESKNDKEFREMLERVTGKKKEALKNKLDKDDYLNLMVTQLKYQDPTKPLENHEMATQLAQFNTVEQLIGVNKTLQSMQNQSAQANIDKLTPYLGRVVEVSGSKLKVGADMKASQGAVELSAQAGSVSVQIKDSTGSVVRTLGLGERDAGRHTIEWDGLTDSGVAAKPGDYTFDVQASSRDGKEMPVKTSFTAKVDAITDLANGGKLDTANGKVEAKDILSIRPESPVAPVVAGAAPAAAAQVPSAANATASNKPSQRPVKPPAATAPAAAAAAPAAAAPAAAAPTAAAPAAAAPAAAAPAAAAPAAAKRERPKVETKEQAPRTESKLDSASKDPKKAS